MRDAQARGEAGVRWARGTAGEEGRALHAAQRAAVGALTYPCGGCRCVCAQIDTLLLGGATALSETAAAEQIIAAQEFAHDSAGQAVRCRQVRRLGA